MCSMTLQHNVIIYNIRATQIFLKHHLLLPTFEMIPFKPKRFVEVIVVRASNIYGSHSRTENVLKLL